MLDTATTVRPGAQGHQTRARTMAVRVDPSRARRAHHEIIARLAAAGGHVTLLTGQAAAPLPPAVDLLFGFERLVFRLRDPRLSDIVPCEARPHASSDDRFDVVVDLCGDDFASADARTLRPLFDGVAGEAALIGALLAGRMPVIEIEDARTGAIIARGAPGADSGGTVLEAFDCVLARLATLTIVAVGREGPAAGALAPVSRPVRWRDMMALETKRLAWSVTRRLYHLCCYAPHWRTCWRIVDGNDLWSTRSLAGTSWNILPDPGFRFYADPFPFMHEGSMHVFVEDLDHRHGKGVISVVPFDGSGPTGAARPVLEEPWHLSYPFLLRHRGEVWMIPESSAARTVTLYRADPFPHRWIPEAILLDGIEASDATIARHGERWWMFAATRDGAGSYSDTLSLFSAPDLLGPWEAHPGNPVLLDQSSARPAGAMVVRDGALWRPVQDCTSGYGTGIGLAEVTRLDSHAFAQTVHHVLYSDPSWPGRRFHTLNRAGWLECIDGAAHSPRSRHLAHVLQDWSGRREEPEHWRRAFSDRRH